MYKLCSTGLYRFTFVLNAWPVDESARSQQIHYTDLPRRHIDATNHSTALVGVDIFGGGVGSRHSLDSLTKRQERDVHLDSLSSVSISL